MSNNCRTLRNMTLDVNADPYKVEGADALTDEEDTLQDLSPHNITSELGCKLLVLNRLHQASQRLDPD